MAENLPMPQNIRPAYGAAPEQRVTQLPVPICPSTQESAYGRARLAVLRQVAARLAHQPQSPLARER